MTDFAAIDVETANRENTSICSIGIVRVENGVITGRFHEYVQPVPFYFLSHFTQNIHGICADDVRDARRFPDVWMDANRFFGELPLVAHNKRFDESCIRAAHRAHGMIYPDYPFYCTLDTARRTIPRALLTSFSLPSLCDFLGIPFSNHHNALADAEACAKIAMALL